MSSFQDFSLAIGYRGDENGYRDQNLEWCLRWWSRHAPGVELCIADSDPDQPFNRSQARNRAVQESTKSYLLIADADSVVEPPALFLASRFILEDDKRWILPYETYYNLEEEFSSSVWVRGEALLNDDVKYEHKIPSPISPPAVSGLLVMSRRVFDEAGGYDERFMGWGWEDNAFALALTALGGPLLRLPGNCYHLWHPALTDTTFGGPHAEANRVLVDRYQRARMNSDKMRELVKGV